MKAYHNSAVLQFDDSTTGNAGAGVPVTVRLNSTQALVSIFDLDEVAIANPTTTDSKGNYAFKTNDGVYDIIISEGTGDEVVLEKVQISEFIGLISDLSQAYEFATVAEYKAFNTAFPISKRIYLADRNSDFTVITGVVGANDLDVISNNLGAESIALIPKESITLKSLGLVGDGIVDDGPAFANAGAYAEANKVATLNGEASATYLINEGVTISSKTTLNLNGATINADFNASGAFIPAVHLASNESKVTNGTINVTGVTGGGGFALNAVFVGSLGTASAGFSNIVISRLTVSSDRALDGALIGIMGGSSNILIENIIAPSSVTSPNIIGCEWRGDATGTEHPHNIVIRNIQAGSIDSSHTHLVWLSSCFNVTVENVWAEKIGNGFYVYGGDRANEWADSSYRDLVGTGININNSGCLNLQGVSGGRAIGLAGKGSSSLVRLPLEVIIKNCRFRNTNAVPTSTQCGIYIEQTSGFKVADCNFDGFYRGVYAAAFTTDFKIEKCNFINSYFNSGFLGTSNVDQIATNGFIVNCLFKDGNTVGTASSLTGSNLVIYGDNVTLEGNVFDSPASTQGLYIISPSKLNKVINNTFVAVRSTGFGMINDSSGNLTIETIAANNVFYAGVKPFAGRPTFYTENSQRIYNSTVVPSNGTHTICDRTYDSNMVAGGYIGWVCTTSGTFGTYAEGLTATTDGTATVTLSGTSATLYRGQYITINATNVRIVSLSGAVMVVDAAIASAAGQAITYQTPVYKAFGLSLV